MSLPRRRPARRRRLAAVLVSLSATVAVGAALLNGATAEADTGPAPAAAPSGAIAFVGSATGGGAGGTAGLKLGLAGPYDANSVRAAQGAGVSMALIEAQWDLAEPAPGVFNVPYLLSLRQAAQTVRAQGFAVSLNVGLHNAPAWLLALPGARYVDQNGAVFTGAPVPNLVFGTNLRTFAQAYLTTLFATLGTNVDLVRVGGGVSGELSYPYTFGSNGLVSNRYWAFDANAARGNPVPGWKPGMPSPAGQASTFLSWYLDALVGYQNWQIQSLRAVGYQGQVAVLYPSFGMRSGDFDKAVATNLSGTSSAEINGEVQRGYDMARQVNALTDTNAVVYGTWGENFAVVTYLAGLAHAKGLAVMAENGGPNPPAVMAATLRNAVANGLQAFFLIRANQMTCGCNGWAQLSDIGAAYRSIINGS